jgi:hypothetical protein
VLSLPNLRSLQQQQQQPSPLVEGLSIVLKLVNPVYGKVHVTLVPEHVARAEAAGR